ncbi:MAG: hypothetical protein AB8C84_05685 [Oligoflexales bacterium]
MNQQKSIQILGAREHNLKDINVNIPKHKVTVITGVSGSGKSSLAFDTILAESQRRFFSTLSHYSRNMLDMQQKPLVRQIKGLCPAIQLAQKETRPSSRANIANDTDLGELFGTLFAQYSETFCPIHKTPTQAQSIDAIVDHMIKTYDQSIYCISFPIVQEKKGQFSKELKKYEFYGQIILNESVHNLPLESKIPQTQKNSLSVIVDTLKISLENRDRLHEALRVACQEGGGSCNIYATDRTWKIGAPVTFNQKAGCQSCGFSYPKMDARFFSTNSLGKCPECQGAPEGCLACEYTGLDKMLQTVTIHGFSWPQLLNFNISSIQSTVATWQSESLGFKTLQQEILKITARIADHGLGHLELRRTLISLSGGELQRLRLSHLLSENLRGLLYVLDEPSQGLHPLEIKNLMQQVTKLKNLGNTILIVDHDQDVMRASDLIIDLGPSGGEQGGKVLACFQPDDAPKYKNISKTAKYLTTHQHHQNPPSSFSQNTILLNRPRLHHLKMNQVEIHRGKLNVICGLSGTGKTSLMQCLHEALTSQNPQLSLGLNHHYSNVLWVDRQPLGKNSTSTPGSWLGAYPLIRELFASLPDAQIYGLTSRDYSLVAKDGARCPNCQGKGVETISMKFLNDSHVLCQLCYGERFLSPAKDIQWNGVTIPDILNSTLEQNCNIFKNQKKILQKIQPAVDLGMGYLKFGQPNHTLSGGEAQRLKMTPMMNSRMRSESILLIDEPTQGLHPYDIEYLMKSFSHLTNNEVTIVAIEHSLDVITQAQHLIELGPSAGEKGGFIEHQGSLSELIMKKTATAQALRNSSFS